MTSNRRNWQNMRISAGNEMSEDMRFIVARTRVSQHRKDRRRNRQDIAEQIKMIENLNSTLQ